MARDLNTARSIVRNSALHIKGSTWGYEKIDDAIKNAGHLFLRVTKASLDTTDVTLSQGVSEVDLTASITGFTSADYEFGEIDNYEVKLVPFHGIRRRFQRSTPTGRPDRIGFRPDDKGLLNKQTDQSYTFTVTHAERFIDFRSGTGSNPTLNLPDEYFHAVNWFGSRYFLLHGAPGHPDSASARDEFYLVLDEARRYYGRVSAGVLDASLPPSQGGPRTARQDNE